MNGFGNSLREFAMKYPEAKKERFSGHPLSAFLRKDTVGEMRSCGLFPEDEYKLAGSVGKGNWAEIPWLAVFKLSETDTLHHGLFIAYVFSADMSTVHLTLNQGSVTFFDSHTRAETNAFLAERSGFYSGRLSADGFTAGRMELGTGSSVGRFLELGNILQKGYPVSSLPSDGDLFEDLKSARSLYLEALGLKHAEYPDDP